MRARGVDGVRRLAELRAVYEQLKENTMTTKKSKRVVVIVRTYSAGVHIGEMAGRKGQEVTLRNARRIWSWDGALSLHEVAQRGIKSGKISIAIPEILLLQAIEIIPASPAAVASVPLTTRAHAATPTKIPS